MTPREKRILVYFAALCAIQGWAGQGGPDIDKHFNLYYLHWWSLAHFLMQCDNGIFRRGSVRRIVEKCVLSD